MKHFLVLACCLLILFAGVLSAVGNCFDALPHHGDGDRLLAPDAKSVGAIGSEPNDDAPRVHCPDLKFSVALARMFSGSSIENQIGKDSLYRPLVNDARGPVMSGSDCAIAASGNGPPGLVSNSVSPHLFLSVIQV